MMFYIYFFVCLGLLPLSRTRLRETLYDKHRLLDTKFPGDPPVTRDLKLFCRTMFFSSASVGLSIFRSMLFKQKPCEDKGVQGGISTEPKENCMQGEAAAAESLSLEST